MPHNLLSIFHFHFFHHLNSFEARLSHPTAHLLFFSLLSIRLFHFTFPLCDFQILHFDPKFFTEATI